VSISFGCGREAAALLSVPCADDTYSGQQRGSKQINSKTFGGLAGRDISR
jgi:hypothetical protein